MEMRLLRLRQQHQEGQGHRRRAATLPLAGGLLRAGQYFATVRVGEQSFRVQVDTGSALLALPAAYCSGSGSAVGAGDSCAGRTRLKVEAGGQGVTALRFGQPLDGCCTADECRAPAAANPTRDDDGGHRCRAALRYGDGSTAEGFLARGELTLGGGVLASQHVTATRPS
jgi:hypothetical protein